MKREITDPFNIDWISVKQQLKAQKDPFNFGSSWRKNKDDCNIKEYLYILINLQVCY
jgi:hypothetical protein